MNHERSDFSLIGRKILPAMEIAEQGIEPSADAVFLYNLGDECTSLTGGWDTVLIERDYLGTHTLTKNADCMSIYCANTSVAGSGLFIGTTNLIDVSNYSRLYIEAFTSLHCGFRNGAILHCQKMGDWTNFYAFPSANVVDGVWQPTLTTDHWADQFNQGVGVKKVYVHNISSITESVQPRVSLCVVKGYSPIETRIYRVWLEP